MLTRKNDTLELLKLFASYMVVFIHVPFYGNVGIAIRAIARFAVPLFFVTSGFFSYQISTSKIKKRVRRLLSLLLFAVVVYTLWNVSVVLIRDGMDGLYQYFGKYLQFKKIAMLLFANVTISCVHLWFLPALIYVYIIFYFATKTKTKDSTIYTVCILLLVLRLIAGEGLALFGFSVPPALLRNFFGTGIPFFGVGLLAKKYEHKTKRLPGHIIPILLIIGVSGTLVSRFVLGEAELYLGSIFILVALIVVFIKYSERVYLGKMIALTENGTYIYIFHMLLFSVVDKVCDYFEIYYESSVVLATLVPLLVCFLSTVFACFIKWIIQKYRNGKKRGIVA